MMERMQTGDICSIVYCTLNVAKKKGGERIEYPEVTLLLPNKDFKEDYRSDGRQMTTLEKTAQTARKRPNHDLHYTRNFRLMIDGQPTGVIKTVHIRLIEQFNGMTVLV